MRESSRLWLTPLHKLEFSHAVAQQVFRGSLSEAHAGIVFERFERDIASFVWDVTDLPAGAFQSGIALAQKDVPKYGTRSFDTLHVASAIELGATEFWTFDERQAKLAKAVGLKVV